MNQRPVTPYQLVKVSSRQLGNPLLDMTSFQYFLCPKMEADFQFNSYRVIYLSLAYHIEHPLYLRLKLSLFPPNSFKATGPGRFQYYLLLHSDVPDIQDRTES